MVRLLAAVAGVCALLAQGSWASSAVAYVNWSEYLFNTSHSSLNAAATAITPASAQHLAAAWSAPFRPAGGLWSSPTVYDGSVYIGTRDGVLYQLSEATGTVLNSVSLGTETPCTQGGGSYGIASTAAVVPDPSRGGAATVYVTAGDPQGGNGGIYLWALDAATFQKVWATDPVALDTQAGAYAWSSPTISQGRIDVGLSSNCDAPLIRGGLAVVNQATGALVGDYYTVPAGSIGGSIWSSAAVSGSFTWVTTGNADQAAGSSPGDSFSIVRLRGTSKVDIWTIPDLNGSDDDFGASPTLFTGLVNGSKTSLVGACNKNGVFYALVSDALARGPVWSYQIATPSTTAPDCNSGAVWDASGHQLIVGGTQTATPIDGSQYLGSVESLSPDASASTRLNWAMGLPCPVQGTPTENGNGVLAVVTYGPCAARSTSSLYVLNARAPIANPLGVPNPQVLKVITLGSPAFSQPTFADGYLLVASNAGGLMAYH